MSAILAFLLFGAALAAAVWTLYVSVAPQLHRYRAMFAPAPVLAELPLRASRVTVRFAPVQVPARTPLRAVA